MSFERILLDKKDCDTKGSLIYSSWSVTWEKLLETFPDAQVEVLERISEDSNRLPYFGNDKIGYIVMVKITIPSKNNWTFTERLAIVDMKNQSILKEEQIDSRDICDTIQRCINKVIARVNIGLNVYQNDFSHIPEKTIIQNTNKQLEPIIQKEKIDFETMKQKLLSSENKDKLVENWNLVKMNKANLTTDENKELENIKNSMKNEIEKI